MDEVLELVGSQGQFVEQTDIMRRSGGTHPTLLRLEEEIIRIRVRHTAIDDESAGQVARRVDIFRTAEEPGPVSSSTYAEQYSRSIPRDESLAGGKDSIMLISHLCRVLPFRDAVAENQNPIGEPLVRREEDLEVFLDHSGEVLDNLVPALLEADLRGEKRAIGIVRGYRAGDGRRAIVPRPNWRLLLSSVTFTCN